MSSHALLPEDMEEHTIAGMMHGDVAYTVPWAMWVDHERRCWLNPGYVIRRKPFGTIEMRIERQAEGFCVWPVAGRRYPLKEKPVLTDSHDAWLPVHRLETGKEPRAQEAS